MKTGQVIGATDRLGGEATERPVQFGEVFATLYQNLGIDVSKVTLPDLSGRPQYLAADDCQPDAGIGLTTFTSKASEAVLLGRWFLVIIISFGCNPCVLSLSASRCLQIDCAGHH